MKQFLIFIGGMVAGALLLYAIGFRTESSVKEQFRQEKRKLKKEREETETKNLERVNTRRKLQGLPPLKKGETIPKTGVDFIQDESLQVMADLIGMKQQ